MPMPPNMNSSDLFAQLASTTRVHKLVPFPRNKPDSDESIFQIAMVILTNQETMSVAAAAEKIARKLLKDDVPNRDEMAKGYNDIFNNASAVELLYRACRDPEDLNRKIFPSPTAIGDVLTTDEISILLNHYFTVQIELGPIVGAMTDEELEAWIKKLAEGGQSSQYFLNSLSWEALKGLLISMAAQLWNSQTAKSSATGLPNERPLEDSKVKTRKKKLMTSEEHLESTPFETSSNSSNELKNNPDKE